HQHLYKISTSHLGGPVKNSTPVGYCPSPIKGSSGWRGDHGRTSGSLFSSRTGSWEHERVRGSHVKERRQARRDGTREESAGNKMTELQRKKPTLESWIASDSEQIENKR
ncbi:hypothetical protein KUCAC02_021128, partial [Chaenocephalus aceratus]